MNQDIKLLAAEYPNIKHVLPDSFHKITALIGLDAAFKRKQAATPPNEMKASGIKSDIQPQATKTAALSGLAQDALKRNEAGYNYV